MRAPPRLDNHRHTAPVIIRAVFGSERTAPGLHDDGHAPSVVARAIIWLGRCKNYRPGGGLRERGRAGNGSVGRPSCVVAAGDVFVVIVVVVVRVRRGVRVADRTGRDDDFFFVVAFVAGGPICETHLFE